MSQENNNTAKLENNSHNEIISLQDKDNKNLKTSFKSLNLSNQSQDTDLVKIEEKLENVYNEYLANKEKIFPGNKLLNDNYSKLVSVLDNENIFLKEPKEQADFINKQVLKLFEEIEEKPKLLTLYSDSLHHGKLKDLEYKNTTNEVKDNLLNYFILKYFRLNNIREKLISKSNNIINFNGLDDKFILYKDFKIGKINTELELTLKRVLRLLHSDDERNKDFEYYLKHYKLKKLDTVFLRNEQTNFHSQMRREDFDIYFRETCYIDKITNYIKNFEPYIRFSNLTNSVNIWKNSKILLFDFKNKIFKESNDKLREIYTTEKNNIFPNEIKIFKEYFKEKYKFYYDLKDKINDRIEIIHQSYNCDIIYPPLITSINSEIKYNLKDLCDYFQIQFDISIDKGKAFSYSIDLFFPYYFKQQSRHFTYSPYELTYNEINNDSRSCMVNDCEIEGKATEILRQTYNVAEGFVINTENKNIGANFKKTIVLEDTYIKKAGWSKYFCLIPSIDKIYLSQRKKIEQIGYIDSLLKYEMDLIDISDFSTLHRLIEEYTMNISSRIRNTIKLRTKNTNYNSLKEIVNTIFSSKKSDNEVNSLTHDDYADKVDGDLLKYFLILRFLKLRDMKYFILTVLNYFRYVQKKFAVDLYKIENKSYKKVEDLVDITEILKNIMKDRSNLITKDPNYTKTLLSKLALSEFTKTNPIIPPMDHISEGKRDFNDFEQSLLDEINETIEYTEKVVRIKDPRGNSIIYDATLSDMKELEMEMSKLGTFFINKHEILVINIDNVPNPIIDRSQVILDLFTCEYEYLFSKLELVSDLMVVYDSCSDIFQQKGLMQLIIDTISRRPYIDLEFNYFTTGYSIETEAIKKKGAFLHTLIDFQKRSEFHENKLIHDSLEKKHWMLGEVALDIIKHVRVDKKDLEIIKRLLNQQKERKSKSDEEILQLENMMDVFEKTMEEREKTDNIEIKNIPNNCKTEEDKTVYINYLEGLITKNETIDQNTAVLDTINISNKLTDNRRNDVNTITLEVSNQNTFNFASYDKDKTNEIIIADEKQVEKTLKRLEILTLFMKKIFSNTLTNSNSEFIENTNDILKTDEDAFENIKEIVNISILNLEEKKNEQNKKLLVSRTNSNNDSYSSLDILNYKVRSLLNIPNSLSENAYMKYVEKNPGVVKSMDKEINFTKFEEGFPYKFSEVDHLNTNVSQIETYDSLFSIMPIFNLIESSFKDISSSFNFESHVSSRALEISYLDYLIEEWNKYKEYITGRRRNENFEEIYFLQNTILDNHNTLLYSIKSLTATLCNNISRIPPNLLVKLPMNIISKIDFDKTDFKFLNYNSNINNLEVMTLSDLNIAFLRMIKKELDYGFLNFPINDKTELKLYCNCVELYRTKRVIEKLLSSSMIIKNTYEYQKGILLNRSEELTRFKDSIFKINDGGKDFVSYNKLNNNKSKAPRFTICEFEESLQNCIDFHDLLTVQSNLLDNGLDEVKSFAHYQYMQYFVLLIGTQYNNVFLSEPLKYLAELELFENYNIVTSKRKIDLSCLSDESTINLKMHQQKNRIMNFIDVVGKDLFYNINDKKLKNRSDIYYKYITFNETQMKYFIQQNTIKNIYFRQYSIFKADSDLCF